MKLKNTLFLLPNAITLASIFCGFDAIRLSSEGRSDQDFFRAALLIMFAAVLDTLDGRVARMTKTQSSFGLQIDSLADLISFGVAPAILAYRWSLHQLGSAGLLFSFAFVACGAVRLARFNVLSLRAPSAGARPGKYIVGLPIPGAAGLLVGLVMANYSVAGNLGGPRYAWVLVAVVVALSALMVSTIQFRSFKDMRLNARTVAFVAAVVGSSAAVSAYFKPPFVLVWLLSGYILVGLVESAILAARTVRPAFRERASRERRRPAP